jgi:hypothetical protein
MPGQANTIDKHDIYPISSTNLLNISDTKPQNKSATDETRLAQIPELTAAVAQVPNCSQKYQSDPKLIANAADLKDHKTNVPKQREQQVLQGLGR